MTKAASELKYNTNLRAPITTAINDKPKARVHSREWQKIMSGDPVEINPSVGYGYKIMSVDEWSARWKQNEDFPECLNCGSKNTKEHHFTQVREYAASVWRTIACTNSLRGRKSSGSSRRPIRAVTGRLEERL